MMLDGLAERAQARIARGQRAAEALMTDTCTLRRPTGETELDEETGQVVPTYDTIYEGRCKVQMSGSTFSSSAQEIGGTVVTVTSRYVHLPLSAPEAKVNDEVLMNTSLGPQLPGKVFRVVSPFAKTYPTARRLEVQEP